MTAPLDGEPMGEPCDACDGHGFWAEGTNPGRIKACEVCGGSRVLPPEEEQLHA